MKYNKFFVCWLLILTVLFSLNSVSFAGVKTKYINITVDSKSINGKAYISNSYVMADANAFLGKLGCTFSINQKSKKIAIKIDTKTITLNLGSTKASFAGKTYTLSAAPVKDNNICYIPLSFICKMLNYNISIDLKGNKVTIDTKSSKAPIEKFHTGTINPSGEIWKKSDSPHIVKGVFSVEGKTSPVLSIEPGSVVLFEENARIEVGNQYPGSIKVNGEASNKVQFTCNSPNKKPGYWGGIWFYENSSPNESIISWAIIEDAGANDKGAVFLNGSNKTIELKLNDVQISNSLFSGVNLKGRSRLSKDSSNLTITKTQKAETSGGYPIIANAYGSDYLPLGVYEENSINAINITGDSSDVVISNNTIWKDIGLPYIVSSNVKVEGANSPVLYVEPSTTTLWPENTSMLISEEGGGKLTINSVFESNEVLDWFWISKPEGGGEWIFKAQGEDPGDGDWGVNDEGYSQWFSTSPIRNWFWIPDPIGSGNWITRPNSDGDWLWISNINNGGDWLPVPQEKGTLYWSWTTEDDGNWLPKIDSKTLPKPDDGTEWFWISGHEDGGQWVPRPEDTGKSIWLSNSQAGGQWISKPDGSGDWIWIPELQSGSVWISKPVEGGEWLWISKSEGSGEWKRLRELKPVNTEESTDDEVEPNKYLGKFDSNLKLVEAEDLFKM